MTRQVDDDGNVYDDGVEYDSYDFGGYNPATGEPAAAIQLGSDTYYYNADGTYTGINENGESYLVTPEQMKSLQDPQPTGNASMSSLTEAQYKEKLMTPSIVESINKSLGINLTGAQLATIGLGGLAGLSGLNSPTIKKVGYQGGLPQLQAQRTMATAPVSGLRPGAGGTNYGGDVQYSPKVSGVAAPAAPAAPVQTVQPSSGIAANPWAGKMNRAAATGIAPTATDAATPAATNVMTPDEVLAAQKIMQNPTVKAAQGGLMAFAHGGSAGRYLQGETDGMADKLRTSIDGKQPAALSHGEFVIPADVVSHLGNGNSDAGAKKLYSMMDKIREARTGTKKQGKQINPDKFMPGGLAKGYAAGGEVQKFVEGGVPSGTTGVDQTLASWTGNYAPNMLAQTQALTATPYQAYTGPLTAGASDLQNQAFAGASENAQAGYAPTTFTGQTFGTPQAQQYMNPYLQSALDPQLAEARRQSEITKTQNDAAMTKAGAFGGGRQAILTAENQRNLGTNLADITGKGYNTAYTNAMAQFNTDQSRGLDTQRASEQSRQYGADYGIKSLDQLAGMGATQRGIESEGIAADKAAFEAARDNPYNQLKFQSQMLNGLPIQATNYSTAQPSTFTNVASGITTVDKLLDSLGLTNTTPP